MAARMRYVLDDHGDRRLVDWDEMKAEMARLRAAGVDLEVMGTAAALVYVADSLDRRKKAESDHSPA